VLRVSQNSEVIDITILFYLFILFFEVCFRDFVQLLIFERGCSFRITSLVSQTSAQSIFFHSHTLAMIMMMVMMVVPHPWMRLGVRLKCLFIGSRESCAVIAVPHAHETRYCS
jgi:hypothetical protein